MTGTLSLLRRARMFHPDGTTYRARVEPLPGPSPGPREAWFRLELLIENRWVQVAQVTLLEPATVDQERLRFSPFRDGKGLTPRGFVHGLRRATYLLSQLARPARAAR